MMEKKYTPEKILIIIALVFFAGIIFYNAFYIKDPSIPTVIYLDKDPEESQYSSDSDNSGSQAADSSLSSNSSNESSAGNTVNGKININSASKDELEKLPGVGDAIAKKIIEYREYNGNFSSIEEIKGVSGIGESKFEKMKNFICV
ncbi:MAG: helix-hairpin-helix domain-containing protein [Clostridia bacterium]|nr:helix-hairpin-helix domain-containing protein [Clostridia bacterium]